jgi:hypothetical protein
MSDLFKKITKGSIMIWNVEDEKALPKIKIMTRLLNLKTFTYYKSDGHHTDYIRVLLRMREARSPEALTKRWNYWSSHTRTSHFLFTEQELENNSFFQLKYMTSCLGSYFVDEADLKELAQLNQYYDRLRAIADLVGGWPEVIADDQERLKKEGAIDTVIDNFDTPGLLKLIDGYGHEAIRDVVSKLDAWHTKHFWKNKESTWVPEDSEHLEEEEITT